MKKIIFNNLDEVIYNETFSNGINAYLYPTDKTKNFYITVSVKYGGNVKEYKVNGIKKDIIPGTAHFLEHKVMNFTNRKKASDLVNKLGLYTNAYTSFDLTNYNVYPDLWNEENDRSLVIGFATKEYHYLIMGDAPKKIESRIMKDNVSIPCDILKVGHHGSNTSSGDTFIKYLSPKVGVISCGKKNKYGHPHSEVVAILNKYKVQIRRTDLEGTITYY